MDTKVCIKCKVDKKLSINYFNKQKSSKDGFRSVCRDCQKKYLKEYYDSNKKTLLKKQAEYQTKNKEQRTKYKLKWAKENSEKIRCSQKKYHSKNPHKKAAWETKRRASKLKATPIWSELDKIEILYKKAKWLEKLTGIKYHVDHVIPLQGRDVCGLHVWANLQIIEDRINFSKSNNYEN